MTYDEVPLMVRHISEIERLSAEVERLKAEIERTHVTIERLVARRVAMLNPTGFLTMNGVVHLYASAETMRRDMADDRNHWSHAVLIPGVVFHLADPPTPTPAI